MLEQKSKSTGQSLPVLIIDDNPADRRLSQVYLDKAWPFQRDLAVDFAADGVEALEKVRLRRYALLVMDWKMPGLGGGEVLQHLRQSGNRTPVVIVSGLMREDLGAEMEALGAAFLNKEQMNPDTLRDAITLSLRLLGFVKPAAAAGPVEKAGDYQGAALA